MSDDLVKQAKKAKHRLATGHPGPNERAAIALTMVHMIKAMEAQAARIERLEAAGAQVQSELCRVANAYAAEGNMAAATAIHDAARCVAKLEKEEGK